MNDPLSACHPRGPCDSRLDRIGLTVKEEDIPITRVGVLTSYDISDDRRDAPGDAFTVVLWYS
jgi:hypothetical protein